MKVTRDKDGNNASTVFETFDLYWVWRLLLLAASWMVSTSSAAIIFFGDSVPLSTLVNNPQGQVVAGDKKFTGFGYDFDERHATAAVASTYGRSWMISANSTRTRLTTASVFRVRSWIWPRRKAAPTR